MDPQIAWEQLLAAYSDGDWEVVEQRATDLLTWLERDGFPPTILRRNGLDPDWNRALARAGCAYALSVLHDQWKIQGAGFPP